MQFSGNEQHPNAWCNSHLTSLVTEFFAFTCALQQTTPSGVTYCYCLCQPLSKEIFCAAAQVALS
jgi:hypothetical protein